MTHWWWNLSCLCLKRKFKKGDSWSTLNLRRLKLHNPDIVWPQHTPGIPETQDRAHTGLGCCWLDLFELVPWKLSVPLSYTHTHTPSHTHTHTVISVLFPHQPCSCVDCHSAGWREGMYTADMWEQTWANSYLTHSFKPPVQSLTHTYTHLHTHTYTHTVIQWAFGTD